MPVVDYRLFINRDLPIRARACESKAVYVTRGEARKPHGIADSTAPLRRITVASATDGTSATGGIGTGQEPGAKGRLAAVSLSRQWDPPATTAARSVAEA